MARRGVDLGNPQFQMGARLRKISLALAIALAVPAGTAVAATKKPSPTPTPKVSVKALPSNSAKTTSKPSAKPTSKTTSQPSAPSASSTKSPSTASPAISVKPKPRPKPRPRKKISVSPSPKAEWPPVGFKPDSGIYAKIPNSKELIGVISAKGNLATQVEACKKFVCGAVQVAAEQGCLWWEIDSKVYAQNKDLVGYLKIATAGSTARDIKTILLISPEPLDTQEFIDSIEVVCHQDARPDTVQSVTFSKVG